MSSGRFSWHFRVTPIMLEAVRFRWCVVVRSLEIVTGYTLLASIKSCSIIVRAQQQSLATGIDIALTKMERTSFGSVHFCGSTLITLIKESVEKMGSLARNKLMFGAS